MFPEIVTTADGSHSLYLKELNEHYHSVHGAIQESVHVFINAGLQNVYDNKKSLSESDLQINILEVGLGT